MNNSKVPANNSDPRFKCEQVAPVRYVPGLEDDARRGLLLRPRWLLPKYLYDHNGSELFEKICQTAEYYPTRTEDSLLKHCAKEIIERTKPDNIFELGSGSSTKTQRLLDACSQTDHLPTYTAFDISESSLIRGAKHLSQKYSWLRTNLLLGDYEAGFENVPTGNGSRLILFLGSTIGNFEHNQAVEFVKDLRNSMFDTDHILLGFDRVKDPDILNAAYNDGQGITAQFNLNVLNVLNKQLGANFETNNFRHSAQYVPSKSQVEMYLVSSCAQRIQLKILNESIDIVAGEQIRTEISRKFTKSSMDQLLVEANLSPVKMFTSPDDYFSLMLAQPN